MAGPTNSFRPENLLGDGCCGQQDGWLLRELNGRACPGSGWIRGQAGRAAVDAGKGKGGSSSLSVCQKSSAQLLESAFHTFDSSRKNYA